MATIALWEAAQSFDPFNHSANIRTYAGWLIWRRLKDEVDHAKRFPMTHKFEEEELIDHRPETEFSETVIEELLDRVEGLPHTDQEILVRRYGLNGAPKWSVEETEQRLGLSSYKIRQSVSRSLRILSRELREIA